MSEMCSSLQFAALIFFRVSVAAAAAALASLCLHGSQFENERAHLSSCRCAPALLHPAASSPTDLKSHISFWLHTPPQPPQRAHP